MPAATGDDEHLAGPHTGSPKESSCNTATRETVPPGNRLFARPILGCTERVRQEAWFDGPFPASMSNEVDDTLAARPASGGLRWW